MSEYRHPDPDCSCQTCNGPSQEVQNLLARNMSAYLDELVVKDDLSKYTPYKWYGGFTDKDGNLVKVEGEQMTHDELLEAIDFLPLDGLHAWMQPALRAVVELHKPTENYHIQPMIDYCYQCQDGTPDEPYPCPTIQAIEKELG